MEKNRKDGFPMTEKEIQKDRAEKGLLYDDGPMTDERIHAKQLCHEYNQLGPMQHDERAAFMGQILGKTGENCFIEAPFWCDYGYNIEVGDYFYANHNCIILDGSRVTFGSHIFLGPNCAFYTAGHPLDVEQRNNWLQYSYPITVGDNVWIGGNTVVLAGVNIGSDTVIGAGSVVTKDIPSGVVAAGNPCRVLREITDADRIKYETRQKGK